MLENVFGNASAERIFFYLYVYKEGYARGIAKTFDTAVTPIQKQLLKFEKAGILASFKIGKTRLFKWNPRYPFLNELRTLIGKAYDYLPEDEKEKYFKKRTRPRRTGKPL